jgi:hypothetical protein
VKGHIETKGEIKMKQGMRVKVTEGIWAGLIGTVEEITRQGVVKIRYEKGKALIGPEGAKSLVEYEPKPQHQTTHHKHDDELSCHYCGMRATDFDFFGAPVCSDCK